ncbi:dienelactone hydrolase protein [Rutstroemia sp. NJR-2017a WRK4]|nr:dienelactone hydrolase protein [Rutstroemia sp. NJR-2017a WRK4]
MASNPPGKCCTEGVKHDGNPTGSSIKIADNIETYVAEPQGNVHKDTAILYLADVYSICKLLFKLFRYRSPMKSAQV